ncbi:MAG: hypothetical protein KC476_11210 [Cyanobacteria bacterium HKST-UBA06]|nr:hypothetical protein [Cyanobacteria bacterium HKST-UBA06]
MNPMTLRPVYGAVPSLPPSRTVQKSPAVVPTFGVWPFDWLASRKAPQQPPKTTLRQDEVAPWVESLIGGQRPYESLDELDTPSLEAVMKVLTDKPRDRAYEAPFEWVSRSVCRLLQAGPKLVRANVMAPERMVQMERLNTMALEMLKRTFSVLERTYGLEDVTLRHIDREV